jgi:hypothetical protein
MEFQLVHELKRIDDAKHGKHISNNSVEPKEEVSKVYVSPMLLRTWKGNPHQGIRLNKDTTLLKVNRQPISKLAWSAKHTTTEARIRTRASANNNRSTPRTHSVTQVGFQTRAVPSKSKSRMRLSKSGIW